MFNMENTELNKVWTFEKILDPNLRKSKFEKKSQKVKGGVHGSALWINLAICLFSFSTES